MHHAHVRQSCTAPVLGRCLIQQTFTKCCAACIFLPHGVPHEEQSAHGALAPRRFAGGWHHVAWLHSTAGAASFERKVAQQCTTAQFGPAKHRSWSADGKFSVTYVTRPLPPGAYPAVQEPHSCAWCLLQQ